MLKPCRTQSTPGATGVNQGAQRGPRAGQGTAWRSTWAIAANSTPLTPLARRSAQRAAPVSSGLNLAVDPSRAISPVAVTRPHRFFTLQKRLQRAGQAVMGLWRGL